MGFFRAIVVSLLLAASSFAQQDSNPLYKLSGNVIDGSTGTALARALVKVSGRAVLTSFDGSFSFDNLPAGKAQVMVTKPGYLLPGDTGLRSRQEVAEVADLGPDTAKLSLKLLPEAVIFGQVTGDDRQPIEQAEVQAFIFAPIDGYTRPRPISQMVRTDEDGNFRIAGLPAGEYYVMVNPSLLQRRLLASTGHEDRAYPVALYYPGAALMAEATPVALVPGRHREVNFSLSTSPAFRVSGKVVAAGRWQGINQPSIVRGPGPWQQLLSADRFDQKSGEFEFRALPAGTYYIQVSGTDLAGQSSENVQKLVVTKAVANFKLALLQGADIPVDIRTEFLKPAFQHNCIGTINGRQHYFNCFDSAVISLQLTAEGEGWDRNFIINPESPVIHGVPMGRYRVKVTLTSPDYYVETMHSGMQDLLRHPLSVAAGTVAPIEVTVRDNAATLKVQISPAKGAQQATVLIVPEGEPPLIETWYGGSSNSTMDFRGLAPGAYQIFAFDSIDRLSYAEAGALDEYSDHAAKINLSAGGTATVSVDVAHVEE